MDSKLMTELEEMVDKRGLQAVLMDPNANLAEQGRLLGDIDGQDKLRRAELRRALLGWLAEGGFEPNWKENPEASKAFKQWRVKFFRFQDLAR